MQIAQQLKVTRKTVRLWLENNTYHDERGWEKGKSRKYTDTAITGRIATLKKERLAKNCYFHGGEYIRMDYAKRYPKEQFPTLWFIEETIRNAGLQTRKPKQKKKGGAEYLLYPAESIRNLGYIHQSADFIGKKYIAGRNEPVNIFSSSYYSPFKLYEIARIEAEKATYAIEQLIHQWRTYPLPDVFRIDNGLQFRGTARGKRSVGVFLKFLLNLDVTPLFGSPSKPWTNPHVEGHNRVFNEKVWNKNFFTSLEQIDRECERFNQESKELFTFRYARLIVNTPFRYLEKNQNIITDRLVSTKGKKMYFTRFVESWDTKTKAFIIVLNETIFLPEKYNHQFVFVEWNLGKELLSIYSEYKKDITLIKEIKFRINL